MNMVRLKLFSFIISLMISVASWASAPLNVTLNQVLTQSLEGPAHHGLSIEINPIQDPNLTAFEVQIKEDMPGPAPWNVYATDLYPIDSATINLPYRNGIYSLSAGKKYCVRLRGVFGDKVSSWSNICGITIPLMSDDAKDSDGDGLSDVAEYNLGSDPNAKDSDQDGYTDGQEVGNNLDVNEVKYPKVEILTTTIDFGVGTPSGINKNQHAFIEIQNTGLETASITNIEIKDAIPEEAKKYFELGSYPKVLQYIPPHNKVRIPISFLPKSRGDALAYLYVSVPLNSVELKPVLLKGLGAGIPDCQISPHTIDFGTVGVESQAALVKYITVANKPPANSNMPKNLDTDFGFTISTTNLAMVPGIRGYVLSPGEQIKIPVLFQHPHVGNFDSQLEIRSFDCGVQQINLKGVAE